ARTGTPARHAHLCHRPVRRGGRDHGHAAERRKLFGALRAGDLDERGGLHRPDVVELGVAHVERLGAVRRDLDRGTRRHDDVPDELHRQGRGHALRRPRHDDALSLPAREPTERHAGRRHRRVPALHRRQIGRAVLAPWADGRGSPCYPRGRAMPDLTPFIAQWGYAAIFAIVILGNVGLPVPEETVLTVSGYLIWQGRLEVLPVVLTAIASAVLGDNIAYWIGRRYGRLALTRFLKISPERIERMQGLVLRYGMLAVFVARFVAGLRFMAGPLAGSTGLSPLRFFLANLLGALV